MEFGKTGLRFGVWQNGLEVWSFVETLLEHGADPTAQDNLGKTPLMDASRKIVGRTRSLGLSWTVEAVAEVYPIFLARWVKALESCHVDIEKYRSREVESGAESFARCQGVGRFEAKQWLARLKFEQGDVHQDLQIKIQFQAKDNV